MTIGPTIEDIIVASLRQGVLHVALSLNVGGTERLVIELARAAATQHRVVICCLDEKGVWAPEAEAGGIEVVALHRQPGFRPGLGRRIARLAAERGLGLVHCHHYSPFVYGSLARLSSPSLRVIFTEHGRLSDAPPSWRQRAVNPLLATLPAAIVSVSHDLRRHMIAGGFSAPRVTVIHNGIAARRRPTEADRVEARRRLGVASNILTICAVSRFDPVKDLPTLLRAFARVVSSGVRAELYLVGDGPERPQLLQVIGERSLQDSVRLLGWRDDVDSLLPGIDVFVNSSISEGISLTLLEAMAAALPVVATGVGGTPVVVIEGETGHLVPSRDPNRLGDAIADLLRDPGRRRVFGDAGRARFEARFTLEQMIDQYLSLYAAVLRGGSPSAAPC